MCYAEITVHHIHYGFVLSPSTGREQKSFDGSSTPLTTSKVSIKQMGNCLFWFDTRPFSHLGQGQGVRLLRELRVRYEEKKKEREGENKRVMQPTACQRCPLEMINGHRL